MSPDELAARDTVRELAAQIAELAASDENAYRERLWRDVNSLRKPERPPVICHLGCWEELLPRAGMVSQDPWLAGTEYELRMLLYKHSIGDDTILPRSWSVPAALELEGEHLWGLPIGYTHSGVARGAWRYEYPIKDEADLDRIVAPRYRHNVERTRESVERLQELFDGIFEVRATCAVPGPGAWLHGWATQLCGVQPLLEHMMDRPQWVHRLMATLHEGFLGVIDQLEAMGILTSNNGGLMACDDLPAPHDAPVPVKHLWGRGESQEFQGVSPRQHEEFLLRYQMPILTRFGLTYYGCCEDLTNKIDLILSIPNLRKFVCSPWTDLGKLVAALGDRYCIEWRQKATDVVFATDMAPIREHLRRGLKIAQGTPIQVVLQELETVNGTPQRLNDWAAAAKEIGAGVG